MSTLHLLEKCGAIPSSHEYHFNRFLHEHVPRGTAGADPGERPEPGALPVAEVEAFSIDDATTTEIDDALSIVPLPAGGWRNGIHIKPCLWSYTQSVEYRSLPWWLKRRFSSGSCSWALTSCNIIRWRRKRSWTSCRSGSCRI
jgi:hypothetical protein